MAEPTDLQMWRSVERTVRDVLLPSISDDWACVIAVQLVGMATYAAGRGADPLPERIAELRGRLDQLAGNPLVAGHWPADDGDDAQVLRATATVLAAAVSDGGVAGDQIRAELRPIVSRHLDDDLAVTTGLMPYFRGQLPDA